MYSTRIWAERSRRVWELGNPVIPAKAGILANNLVRWVMATAAYLGEVLPRLLSFTGAKRVLTAFAAELRLCTNQRLSVIFATVLAVIASLRLPMRPNRTEPRAKKRRPKNLPLLMKPRQQARWEILKKRISWA